jgi:hypothetical protein
VAVTFSGDTTVTFIPMKSENGGCLSARHGDSGFEAVSFMRLRLPQTARQV